MTKLTPLQVNRLVEVSQYRPTKQFPQAAFWKASATDRSLIRRGLIERADMRGQLDGGMSVTWHGCRLTEAGRNALPVDDA